MQPNELALGEHIRVRERRVRARVRGGESECEGGEEEHVCHGLEDAAPLDRCKVRAPKFGNLEIDKGKGGTEDTAGGTDEDCRHEEEDVDVDGVGDVELDG